jgi:hypothetical protein
MYNYDINIRKADTGSATLLGLAFSLHEFSASNTYLVIIGQVASLTHAHRVQQTVSVLAIPGILVTPVLPVAARAHVLYKTT